MTMAGLTPTNAALSSTRTRLQVTGAGLRVTGAEIRATGGASLLPRYCVAEGLGMLAIATFTQAGFPLLNARSRAGRS
jgi:hypothetical protein